MPKDNNEFSYTNILARISPFASDAQRSPTIQKILKNTFEELEKTKVSINQNMPSKVILKGKPFVSPSKNVILGKKKKKKYCCSICGDCKHNSQKCPMKNK